MKKLLTPFLLMAVCFANAQVLSWTPAFIQETSMPVTITADANYGNKALFNYNPFDVYVHMGIITTSSTTPSDWRHVRTVWGTTYAWEKASIATGKSRWTFKIDSTTSLRDYFGITDPNEHILKIAIIFRSGSGGKQLNNTDGTDMFIPVYSSGENVRIDVPYTQPTYTPELVPINAVVGTNVPITANASLAGSAMNVYFNGTLLSSATGTTISTSATVTNTGTQTIVATATSGGITSSDTVTFYVATSNTIAAVPAGNSDGINYEPGDTSATVVLYAPNKGKIVMVGDFNNWTPNPNYQMNVTPDGNRFWLRLTGLITGKEYAYQYLMDDTLQLADYNSDKILDKSVDPQIPATTYPNLKPFPVKAAGSIVSVLQTAQTPYVWQVPNFNRPDKRNLLIYELWVKDFVYSQNWQALTDTLFYLKKLGVNAIEIMPFNNFEGYSSWGYNSNFFLAPDKVYGTRTALRQFVDACHLNGMAVILDLAMADVSGSSPLAKMYWNSSTNTPAANNPWLNAVSTNSNVVGSQFNHSSQATIDLRNRVYKHWLKDYNLDGFRFDLFGGYTQNNSDGSYDATRVSTAANINASLQSISPGSYCILESFEPENADQVNKNGVLVWGNGKLTSQVSQADESNLDKPSDFVHDGLYTNNGCTQAGLVDYQESHDEPRVMYNIEQYGKVFGSYSTKTVATALQRAAMGTAFWALMPGPKMIWMFGELGYDYGDNACANGKTTCGRLDPKPIPWGSYYSDPNRQALYKVYSQILNLRNLYPSTFYNANTTNTNTSGLLRWMNIYSPSLQVTVYGNFDVVQQTGNVSFPSNGTWYNLFTGTTLTVFGYTASVTLNPGEFYVYVNLQNVLPVSWVDFTGHYQNGGTVALNWSATNELSNDHYDIERSIDGKNFTHVGTVDALRAANGKGVYNYIDVTAPEGKIYYRIKQLDVTGKYSFSKVIAVESSIKTNSWHTFYAGGVVKVLAQTDMNRMNVVLQDASGKVLARQNANNVTNGQVLQLATNTYSKGLYLITVSSDKGIRTDKVIVR